MKAEKQKSRRYRLLFCYVLFFIFIIFFCAQGQKKHAEEEDDACGNEDMAEPRDAGDRSVRKSSADHVEHAAHGEHNAHNPYARIVNDHKMHVKFMFLQIEFRVEQRKQ